MQLILSLVLIIKMAHAGEWATSSGQMCLDKCSYKNDNYYFYWCHVTDLSGSYSGGGYWNQDPDNPGTHLKWDFCVPSELDYSDDKDDDVLDWNEPEDQELEQEEQGIIRPKGPSTALYKFTRCQGVCNAYAGSKMTCPLPSGAQNHPLGFLVNGVPSYYCVDERMPFRDQLSSDFRLWCQDPCRKGNNGKFFCNTMYGPDDCSPQDGVGSNGDRCTSPCLLHDSLFDSYYFCYTSSDNQTYSKCGMWNVPQEKRRLMEFTRYDYVCADYCQEDEDKTYEWCHHLYWDYNSTTNEATLQKTWDYCRGHAPPPMEGWKIALICLGVLGGIAVIVLLAYFLMNR